MKIYDNDLTKIFVLIFYLKKELQYQYMLRISYECSMCVLNFEKKVKNFAFVCALDFFSRQISYHQSSEWVR